MSHYPHKRGLYDYIRRKKKEEEDSETAKERIEGSEPEESFLKQEEPKVMELEPNVQEEEVMELVESLEDVKVEQKEKSKQEEPYKQIEDGDCLIIPNDCVGKTPFVEELEMKWCL